MVSSSVLVLAYSICAVLCISSLHTVVMAIDPAPVNLTYYLQEIVGGSNTTLLPAAGTGQGNYSASGWGTFFVFDSPLKEGPTADSKLLGKSNGTAIVTTIGGIPTGGIQLSSQHIFNNASSYYGSSITVTGTVDFLNTPPWECIVPGGTGYFRGYRGYAIAELLTAAGAALVVYKWNIYLSK